MPNSFSKTIGIILVAILVLLVALAGLRWFGWPFRHHVYFFPLTLSFLSLLWILLAVWVYRDAESRGMSGVLWALLVLIGNFVGILIYLIVRSERKPAAAEDKTTVTCPACGQTSASNYKYCPHCGKSFQSTCPSCGKPAESSWKACPYCGQKLPS
jgi:endogenous inhibitor of DNA gyrase (YacG/DUF329 family)